MNVAIDSVGPIGTFRALVVGAGWIGAGPPPGCPGSWTTHADAYVASPRTHLGGVFDLDPQRAALAAARHGTLPFCGHLGDALKAVRPAIVSVCTPDSTHGAISKVVLEFPSVRGVLLEKPLALAAADGADIVSLARRNGVVLAVNYSRRWASGIRELRETLRRGGLGAIQSVSGHYANGWVHNGTHWIDLAQMLVGKVVAVRSMARRSTQHSSDPSIDAEFVLTGGIQAVVLGHYQPRLSLFEMDILGEKGRVRLTKGGMAIDLLELAPSKKHEGYLEHRRTHTLDGGLDGALLNAVDDLAASMVDGGRPACTGSEALSALHVAEAAVRGGGSWVVL